MNVAEKGQTTGARLPGGRLWAQRYRRHQRQGAAVRTLPTRATRKRQSTIS